MTTNCQFMSLIQVYISRLSSMSPEVDGVLKNISTVLDHPKQNLNTHAELFFNVEQFT